MRALPVVRWVARSVVGLTSVAVLGAVGFGWATYQGAVDDLVTDEVIVAAPEDEADAQSPRELPRTAQTILLVGIDSRTDNRGNPLPQDVLDAMRAGEADGEQNTDTMILVHVPADPAKRAFAVSLPRDSYVDIGGGFGMHKLNSAYVRARNAKASELSGSGADEATVRAESTTAGRRNLIATVSALTGLRVDHYAEINLYGFSELTKAVGGVPVCLTAPVDDDYSGARFRAGHQVLQGVDALKFVRQRHGLPGGDLDRVRRQQAFLAGLANRVFSAGTLTDPGRVTAMVDALTRSVVLDQNWNLLAFAEQIQDLTGDRIEFTTIPTGRPDLPTPDGSAVEVDPAQVRAHIQDLLGTPTPAQAPPDKQATPPDERSSDAPVIRKSPPGPAMVYRFAAATTATQDTTAPITADQIPCVN
ncbi:LCP family protein [Actinophytocola xanthii]|uniref:Cell envelope-related transcriptional attenuator domain-containing protein n=1 Tax=Actinophytocola xanthii TaxID=1912961 RepID=A0A1Q8CE01_9PSEU|nr:LCP family protein [Actinophytocola xanthii]OLF12597.1 hypothetical protein BU204_28585 [Actinophytocola xanthii]